MYPAGTSGRLEVANVALEVVLAVTLLTDALIVPPVIVAFCNVRLPTVVVVEPSVNVALPSVVVTLAIRLFGNFVATLLMVTLLTLSKLFNKQLQLQFSKFHLTL